MSYVFLQEDFAPVLREQMSGYGRALLAAEASRFIQAGPYSVVFSPGKAPDRHAYYSQAPYWWPDDDDESKPYVRRDGQVNPGRFTDHERAMFRLCDTSLLLAQAGYFLSDAHFCDRAALLLNTWFIAENTRMAPHLRYAQAIPNVCDGRFIGLIDSTALINVVHAAGFLEAMEYRALTDALRGWFEQYLTWLLTDDESQKERLYMNNHALWWNAQSTAFAAFIGDKTCLQLLADEFRTRLLPEQMDENGAFYHELERTRSYMYANFALEACAVAAQAQKRNGIDLYSVTLPDGRCLEKGARFLAPYVENPFLWKWPQLHGEPVGDKVALQLIALARNADDIQQSNRSARINAAPFTWPSHLGAPCLLPGYGEF